MTAQIAAHDHAATLAATLLADPLARRELALRSRLVFAALYLGLATPKHWQAWSRFFDEGQFGLLLAPRAHGKTEFALRVLVLSEICRNRNVRILIISRKFGGAQKSLLAVKSDLERNALLREDFAADRPWHPTLVDVDGERPGKEKGRGLPWTQRALYVDRDRTLKDPTVECVGVFGAITGGRFDLIIVDDPEDDQSVRKREQRNRLEEWLNSSVFELLEPDGRVLVIMTRKHHDDLAARLMRDPRFRVRDDKAILRWPGGAPAFVRDGVKVRPAEPDRSQWTLRLSYDDAGREVIETRLDAAGNRLPVFEHLAPGAEVLWPEKWPIELLLVKFTAGWVRALREQQQFVVDDGSSELQLRWLEAARDRGVSLSFVEDDHSGAALLEQLGIDMVFGGWDLALLDDAERAEESDSDWTVGIAVGLNCTTWDRILLRLVRRRGLTPGATRTLVRTEAARFGEWTSTGRMMIGIEVNAFGKLHQIELSRATDLPLVPHTTTAKGKTDAATGIPRLATLLENGKYTFPYAGAEERALVDVLIAEAHGFGVEAHDDVVMAWWILESVIGRYQRLCEALMARGEQPPHVSRRAVPGPTKAGAQVEDTRGPVQVPAAAQSAQRRPGRAPKRGWR